MRPTRSRNELLLDHETRRTFAPASTGAPFLRAVESLPELTDPTVYPFNIPAFSSGSHLQFESKVTFFVGIVLPSGSSRPFEGLTKH